MSILKIENLTIGYKKALVEDINLEIEKGRLIFLLGENGSGKSTLMKTLFKIIPPLKGKILYQGINIQEMNAKAWSEIISAVFSRMGIVPMIKVSELIEIGLYKADKELKDSIVRMLDIE